jgi:hypothetical protein
MRIAIFGAALVLAGCVTSPVAELVPGTYTVSVNSSFAGSSRTALYAKVTGRADEFCAKQGKVAHVINENAAGVTGITAAGVTLAFSCTAAENASN